MSPYRSLPIVVSLLACAAFLTPLFAYAQPTGPSDGFSPNNPEATGMQMSFDDEFNTGSISRDGIAGNTIWSDSATWFPIGWTLSEYVQDGILQLPVDTLLVSVNSQGKGWSQKYGFFEVRMQLAGHPSGITPGFFALSQLRLQDNSKHNPLELDIVGSPAGDVTHIIEGLHTDYDYPDDAKGARVTSGSYVNVGYDTTQVPHLYGAYWSPSDPNIYWYVDGQLAKVVPKPLHMDDSPLFLVLVSALSGGNPAYVDWVRVWQFPNQQNFGTCTGSCAANAGGAGGGGLPGPCSLAYGPSDPVPTGYGAAYDLFGTTHALVVNVTCPSQTPFLTVGSGATNQYIYRQGYVYQNNSWQPVNLTSQNNLALVSNTWYTGSAGAALPPANFATWTYAVGYTCNWDGSAWKCGCSDTACTTHNWQLQAFRR